MDANGNTAKEQLGSTWYVLRRYTDDVREYTVTKSTSQTVWYKVKDWEDKETGQIRQERKGDEWFPSRREALAERRKRLERDEENARNRYSQAVERLKKFNAKYAGELG